MCNMTVPEFKEFIKNRRAGYFESPYDLVYRVFCEQGFNTQPADYFLHNASHVVEVLRNDCWNSYRAREQEFIVQMLSNLIDDTIEHLDARTAINRFIETYPDHIYQLSLSITNSRRSRAGKEFEAIIELILMGAGVSVDTQGNIGKTKFVERGLGKLVDVVSPGVVEYNAERSDVVLISAKTSLRERWQEVPEEMGRTGAGQMFLVTLDDSISNEVFQTLYDSNIRVTTTRAIKEENYQNNRRVLDFERLVEICLQNAQTWDAYDFTFEERQQIQSTIELQIKKHQQHDFVRAQYADRLQRLLGNERQIN